MTAPQPESFVVGIDIGSQMSRITKLELSKKMPTVQRNALSNEGTPSCISYPPGELRLVGESAGPKELSKPQVTVGSILDVVDGSAAAAARLTARGASVVDGTFGVEGSAPAVEMGDAGAVAAPQLTSFFMNQLLQYGSLGGGADAKKIAVAAPTSFSAASRQTLLSSLMLASGKSAEDIIVVEDTEAAAAYFHHLQFDNLAAEDAAEEAAQDCIIVNIGHSTSSAVHVRAKKMGLEVIAKSSCAVGSREIDSAVASHIFAHIQKKHNSDVSTHAKSHNKVYRDSRKAKEMLSTTDSAQISLECLAGDIDVNMAVKRVEMEQLIAPFLTAIEEMLMGLKVDVPTGAEESSKLRVECIGGGWRSPAVQSTIKKVFGVSRLGVGLDSNLAVAEGCAIVAALEVAKVTEKKEGDEADAAIHAVHYAKIAVAPTQVATADAATLEAWRASEAALIDSDNVFKARLSAKDRLESLILRTREVLPNLSGLSGEDAAAINAKLDAQEQWLWDDCDDVPADAIAERTDGVQKDIEGNEHIAAYYEEQRKIQQEKDEELARLSKLQEEDKELKSDPQRLRGAQQRREQGQKLFREEHFQEAQTRFVQALGILGQLYDTSAEETKDKKREISLSCHLNVASCSVKLAMWKNAVNNATQALELDPNNAKAYFRRGQAKHRLHDYDDAQKDLEKAKELTNGDAGVVAELEAVKAARDQEKAKEKKLFSKMFG